MNQKEYKAFLKRPKKDRPPEFFYFRNKAEKILNYKRNKGLTIHHLRDTQEQRDFNDKYYERWGIDFNNEMKYCICITTEEHTLIHKLSQETKNKISQSVKQTKAKTKLSDEQRQLNKQKTDKKYQQEHSEDIKEKHHRYYLKNKEHILAVASQHKKKNREHYTEYEKEWRKKNHEHYLEYKRNYYKKTHQNKIIDSK